MNTEKFICDGCKAKFHVSDLVYISSDCPAILCDTCYEESVEEAEEEHKKNL